MNLDWSIKMIYMLSYCHEFGCTFLVMFVKSFSMFVLFICEQAISFYGLCSRMYRPIFSIAETLGVGRSCWRVLFPSCWKNQIWEWVLGTIGDALCIFSLLLTDGTCILFSWCDAVVIQILLGHLIFLPYSLLHSPPSLLPFLFSLCALCSRGDDWVVTTTLSQVPSLGSHHHPKSGAQLSLGPSPGLNRAIFWRRAPTRCTNAFSSLPVVWNWAPKL
jgi:hypothetical protein